MPGVSEEPETIDIEPMEFKLAPELRRSAFYLAVMLAAIPLLVLGVPSLMGLPEEAPPGRSIGTLLLLAGAVLLCLWVHHWRLRVDNEGIHRRILFRWKSWPWDDFAEGRVLRERGSTTFTFLDGKGGFTLGHISQANAAQVERLVNRVWSPPPQPEAPSQLRVGVLRGFQSRRQVNLSSTGLETDWSGRMRAYRWEEVAGISLELEDHFQQGFDRLRISLPDTEVELRVITQQGNRRPNWRGAEAREIVAFLMNHVPEEKFRIAALQGPAHSLADFDARSAWIEKALRRSRKNVAVGMVILLGYGIWIGYLVFPRFPRALEGLPLTGKILAVIVFLLAAVGFLAMFGVAFYVPRVWQRRRRELEAGRERFLEEHRAEPEDARR